MARTLLFSLLLSTGIAASACSEPTQLIDDVPAVCRSVGYPEPPASSRIAGSTEFVVAYRTVNGGDVLDRDGRPSYLRVGLNLDRTCTGTIEGASCVEQPWATANHDDGPEGQDNAFGALVFTEDPTGQATVGSSEGESSGRATTLIRVRGYNELADDDRVEVALYEATMAHSPSLDVVTPPKGDGSDTWNILSPWLASSGAGVPILGTAEPHGESSSDAPAFVDSNAYVRGNTLVATFPRIITGDPQIGLFEVHSVTLMARIVHRHPWSLEQGLLGGRVTLSEALRFFGGSFRRGDDQSVCAPPATDETYLAFKLGLCSYADIQTEGNDPSAPCDAISVGFAFTATGAQLSSTVVSVMPNSMTCPPGSGADTCDRIR